MNRHILELLRSHLSKGSSDSGEKATEYYQQPTVQVAISGIIAALYATMLVLFSFSSFGPIQVRIADALMPLALVFGYAGAIGLGVGCLVGNYFGVMTGMTTPFDVVGGALANFLAGIIAYRLYQTLLMKGKKGIAWTEIAILVENITVTLIVGTYLTILVPFQGLWYIGIFLGSLVSMNIIGYIVYRMTRIGLL